MFKGFKSILMMLPIVFVSVASQAQWSIGPKFSVGTITTGEQEIRIIPNSDKLPPELMYNGGHSVRSMGFMLHNALGPGFLQIEALGTKYDMDFTSMVDNFGEEVYTYHSESNYILELPVTAGLNIHGVKIGAGPLLEINVDKESELEMLKGYKDNSKKLNGGFQALLGYTKGIIHLDLKYVYRFSSIVDEFSIGNDRLKLNRSANRLTFSVGFAF